MPVRQVISYQSQHPPVTLHKALIFISFPVQALIQERPLLVPCVAKDLKFMDQENVSSYRIAEN